MKGLDIDNEKLVSVIMPVYNAENFVEEAIQSIIDQTYTNFEFLIFNDASTDRSLEIIQTFSDSRIKLFNYKKNTGYLKHLNEGLKLAEGKYIARMDADDISLPDRLLKQVQFMETHPEVGVCGTAIEIFGDRNEVKTHVEHHKEIKLELLLRSPIVHPSVVIRKSLMDNYNLNYDSNFYTAEDYHLWVQLSTKTRLHNLQEVLLRYRWHKSNISVSQKERQYASKKQIQKEALQQLFVTEQFSEEELEIHSFLIYPYNKGIIDWQSVSTWFDHLQQISNKSIEHVLKIYSGNIFTLATINRSNSKNYFPFGYRLLNKYSNKNKIAIIKLSLLTLFKVIHRDHN